MNRILLITTFFAIAGCATPGQEPGQSAHLQALESASDRLTDSSQPATAQTVESFADNSTPPDSQAEGIAGTEDIDGIEDIDAPNVGKTPVGMLPPPALAESEMVCTREASTGSIIKTKVCRSRAEIERQRELDQKDLRQIKTQIAVGAPRPGMGPGQF